MHSVLPRTATNDPVQMECSNSQDESPREGEITERCICVPECPRSAIASSKSRLLMYKDDRDESLCSISNAKKDDNSLSYDHHGRATNQSSMSSTAKPTCESRGDVWPFVGQALLDALEKETHDEAITSQQLSKQGVQRTPISLDVVLPSIESSPFILARNPDEPPTSEYGTLRENDMTPSHVTRATGKGDGVPRKSNKQLRKDRRKAHALSNSNSISLNLWPTSHTQLTGTAAATVKELAEAVGQDKTEYVNVEGLSKTQEKKLKAQARKGKRNAKSQAKASDAQVRVEAGVQDTTVWNNNLVLTSKTAQPVQSSIPIPPTSHGPPQYLSRFTNQYNHFSHPFQPYISPLLWRTPQTLYNDQPFVSYSSYTTRAVNAATQTATPPDTPRSSASPARPKTPDWNHRGRTCSPRFETARSPSPSTAYCNAAFRPPQRLHRPQPLLLIIDLNGTLLARGKSARNFYRRPGLPAFLSHIFDGAADGALPRYRILVWTSARPATLAAILPQLLVESQRDALLDAWARDTLGLSEAEYYLRVQVYKRLGRVWKDERVQAGYPSNVPDTDTATRALDNDAIVSLPTEPKLRCWGQHNTLLLDDSVLKAAAEPYNLVCVPEFERAAATLHDDVLAQATRYVDEAAWYADVSAWMRTQPFVAVKPAAAVVTAKTFAIASAVEHRETNAEKGLGEKNGTKGKTKPPKKTKQKTSTKEEAESVEKRAVFQGGSQ